MNTNSDLPERLGFSFYPHGSKAGIEVPPSASHFLASLFLAALCWLWWSEVSCLGALSTGKNQAGEEIRIGFWNLQTLRDFSRERQDFRAVAQAVHHLDCIALAEVYDERAASKLVNELTIIGGRWNKVKNRRAVGFTLATSQRYTIVYRSDRLEVVGMPYTLAKADAVVPGDLGRQRLEHPPLFCKFATLDQRLDFTLMLMVATERPQRAPAKPGVMPSKPHAPTDAEIEGLRDLFVQASAKDPHDRDLILIGNLQRDVGTPSLAPLMSLPGIVDLARPEQPTSLEGSHTFEHIFFQKPHLAEFNGKSGVDRFEQTWFNGNIREAMRACSDHRPIWFSLTVPARDDD